MKKSELLDVNILVVSTSEKFYEEHFIYSFSSEVTYSFLKRMQVNGNELALSINAGLSGKYINDHTNASFKNKDILVILMDPEQKDVAKITLETIKNFKNNNSQGLVLPVFVIEKTCREKLTETISIIKEILKNNNVVDTPEIFYDRNKEFNDRFQETALNELLNPYLHYLSHEYKKKTKEIPLDKSSSSQEKSHFQRKTLFTLFKKEQAPDISNFTISGPTNFSKQTDFPSQPIDLLLKKTTIKQVIKNIPPENRNRSQSVNTHNTITQPKSPIKLPGEDISSKKLILDKNSDQPKKHTKKSETSIIYPISNNLSQQVINELNSVRNLNQTAIPNKINDTKQPILPPKKETPNKKPLPKRNSEKNNTNQPVKDINTTLNPVPKHKDNVNIPVKKQPPEPKKGGFAKQVVKKDPLGKQPPSKENNYLG